MTLDPFHQIRILRKIGSVAIIELPVEKLPTPTGCCFRAGHGHEVCNNLCIFVSVIIRLQKSKSSILHLCIAHADVPMKDLIDVCMGHVLTEEIHKIDDDFIFAVITDFCTDRTKI